MVIGGVVVIVREGKEGKTVGGEREGVSWCARHDRTGNEVRSGAGRLRVYVLRLGKGGVAGLVWEREGWLRKRLARSMAFWSRIHLCIGGWGGEHAGCPAYRDFAARVASPN